MQSSSLKQLWVLMAIVFVDMIGFLLVTPLLPFYATNLGARPLVVTMILSAFSLAQLLSAPFWGRFSDRYGRRPALLVGLASSAVAFALFGLANSIFLLFALPPGPGGRRRHHRSRAGLRQRLRAAGEAGRGARLDQRRHQRGGDDRPRPGVARRQAHRLVGPGLRGRRALHAERPRRLEMAAGIEEGGRSTGGGGPAGRRRASRSSSRSSTC